MIITIFQTRIRILILKERKKLIITNKLFTNYSILITQFICSSVLFPNLYLYCHQILTATRVIQWPLVQG